MSGPTMEKESYYGAWLKRISDLSRRADGFVLMAQARIEEVAALFGGMADEVNGGHFIRSSSIR